MHSLGEKDQTERSQRPEDVIRAGHIWSNMFRFVAILGIRGDDANNRFQQPIKSS